VLRKLSLLFVLFAFVTPPFLHAQDKVPPAKAEVQAVKTPPNFFAEKFYIQPDQRTKNGLSEIRGFLFIEKPDLERQSNYAIVTNFADGAVRSRSIPNLKTPDEVRKWVDDRAKIAKYQGAEIKCLSLANSKGEEKQVFWVGHKTFSSAEEAKGQIDETKKNAEAQGGNFVQMVEQAQTYVEVVEGAPVEVKTPAQYEKEEQIALKILDQLQIGTKLFGPFQGVSSGLPIDWQSFGETSWRETNLTSKSYNAQVGYWTNRLVFRGIRAPLHTVDPFVEVTPSLESVQPDYKSYMLAWAGLEWRPLARNAFISNFRPWSLPLLDWLKNARFYVMYGNRYPIKGEITGSKNYNLVYGLQFFYEWGIDLPGAGEGRPDSFPDYLRRFGWGEYYGDYKWETTNFSSEKYFGAFIANSSVLLGFRLPGIPLPDNPINNEFVLMPYMKLEHVNNSDFSFDYQNRYFVGAGVRWMPFRTYAFKENEWLAKMKIFLEWDGVGGVFNSKQGDGDSTGPVQHDLRIGINFSSRRY
jgi:hypothetical protein